MSSQQTEPPAKRSSSPGAAGQISGRVVRADSLQPLAKAVVTLWPVEQPSETLSTRTDSSGNFAFREVPIGTYRLRAQRRGFVTQLYGQRGSGPGLTVPVAAGEHKAGVDFVLMPAGVITGTIYDEDYEPVEEIEVAALRLRFVRGGKRTAQMVRTTRTNDLGQYRLAGLEPGFYLVLAAGSGSGVPWSTRTDSLAYVPAFYLNAATQEEARQVRVVSGGETTGVDISVRTSPTYTLSGVIMDTTGGSGPKRYSVGFARGIGVVTMASREASFTFRGLTPGEYTLVAIVIGQSASLRGQARMEDQQPFHFGGLYLSVVPEIEEAPTGGASLESDGRFAVRELPAGEYTLQLSGRESEVYLKQVRCEGQDHSARPVTLRVGETLECTLLLSHEVGEVRGRVEQEGRPAAGMVVVLIPRERELRRQPRYTMVAQTNPDGQFEIRGVIPGDYLAFALEPLEDANYFALDFAERNRDAAEPVTVAAQKSHFLRLNVATPR
ncbi:MAG: carboxypeptidase-like regulatory domain-containing protein [Firmicutes bacterium]|nr:carboxypeptidase-like regulatory domain-containing protein [Bacillota bacterium]